MKPQVYEVVKAGYSFKTWLGRRTKRTINEHNLRDFDLVYLKVIIIKIKEQQWNFHNVLNFR